MLMSRIGLAFLLLVLIDICYGCCNPLPYIAMYKARYPELYKSSSHYRSQDDSNRLRRSLTQKPDYMEPSAENEEDPSFFALLEKRVSDLDALRDNKTPLGTMRFGKRSPSPLGPMRFGKRSPLGPMRFGKRSSPLGPMRFGKRSPSPLGPMRFGKRSPSPLGPMRFGKRDFDM